MRTIIIILFLSLNRNIYCQEFDIDTTFTIKTNQSEIFISSNKTISENLTSSRSFMGVKFDLNNAVIEEAHHSKLLSGEAYVEIEYDETCRIKNIKIIRKSKNSSFNSQLLAYFDEFILVYEKNNLKKYLGDSDEECGPKITIFSFSIN